MNNHLDENKLSEIIIGKCIKIHSKLGAGLFESVYEAVLFYELSKDDIYCERQKPISVQYENINFEIGFIADIIVENKVILELKSIENILNVHKKQLLTYLRLTGLKLGLLINFNSYLIKDGITRIVNNL